MADKTWFTIAIVTTIFLLISLDITTIITVNHYQNLKFYNSHIAALILARGGSKGLLRKNIVKLYNNNTLLGNSLNTLLEFGKFNSVWVSTDDEQIALEAKKFNVNVHFRAAYTATDYAPSILAVKEFLKKHSEIDIIGLIQCTSPFMKKQYLQQAFNLLQHGYHSVFSVTRQFKLRWKINLEGEIQPDNFSPLFRPRRQDWTGEMVENGMFYFTYTQLINLHGLLQSGRLSFVEVPFNESLEIDSLNDLVIANALIQNSKLIRKGLDERI